MKYQVVGKNIVVTDAINDAIFKKLSHLEKYFKNDDNTNCRCVVRSYKNGAKVEVTIFTPDTTFRAEVKDQDLYNAIDESVEKLAGQMRKLKTKLSRRVERTGLGKSIALEEIISEEGDGEEDEVVRTKSITLKPITLDEAILEMEAINHDFYMYLDTDDEQISVVYRRKEGGYGLIQATNKVDLK